jgi:hypothetical protein
VQPNGGAGAGDGGAGRSAFLTAGVGVVGHSGGGEVGIEVLREEEGIDFIEVRNITPIGNDDRPAADPPCFGLGVSLLPQ